MPLTEWLRPPRRVLAVFLCLMVLLGGVLAWLGWRVLEQDRSLVNQRVQERLEQAADHALAALQRGVSETEGYSVELVVSERGVIARPPGRLLYYPAPPPAEEPPPALFAQAETLEFRNNDPAKAAEALRPLARSPDAAVRAAALVRLGRNLRKAGRNEEALQAFSELGKISSAHVLGLPAELVAIEARCSVLEATGRRHELRKEASVMHEGLRHGRWPLAQDAWEFRLEEARQWAGVASAAMLDPAALALSKSAEWVHRQWQGGAPPAGRRILKFDDQPVLISWSSVPGQLTATLAAPEYVSALWSNALQSLGVQGALVDADGQTVLGAIPANTRQAIRAADARFPWTLHLASADPGGELADVAARRRLLLAGFGVLALILLAGSYFILRSIHRELAVARLQSEFVSAVSHEFRTPLTSLRQLSEMLAKGRVPNDALRQQSYEILARESERLQRLVESLLDFGRIEGSAFRYRFEPLDPAALMCDLIADFQNKTSGQDCRIEFTPPAHPPLVRADREALGLALWNLLDNAAKYSPASPTVWIEMGRDRDRLAIRVRDRGMGIPESEQKHIFQKFVRGAASRAANIRGTGIGLPMALQIIEAHEGEIRLESQPGQGSTFTVLLPVEKAAENGA